MIPHKLSQEEARLQAEVRLGADHPAKGAAADRLAFKSTSMPTDKSVPPGATTDFVDISADHGPIPSADSTSKGS